MILWELFITFVQIGLFSFGGGYASLPLISQMVVSQKQWLTMKEMQDMVTISQMTPGPIGINAATFTGQQVAGFWGSVCATSGFVFPSMVLVTMLAMVYIRMSKVKWLKNILQYLRPVVVALIAGAGLSMLVSALFPDQNWAGLRWELVFLMVVCLYFLVKKKANPLVVMAIAGAGECLLQGLLHLAV